MRMFDRLARLFGLMPPRPYAFDIDMPHYDSAFRAEIPGSHLDAVVSPLRVVPDLGDGPAAPTPSPGAAGIHPSHWPTDWRQQLGHVQSVLDALLADHDAGRINLNTQ